MVARATKSRTVLVIVKLKLLQVVLVVGTSRSSDLDSGKS